MKEVHTLLIIYWISFLCDFFFTKKKIIHAYRCAYIKPSRDQMCEFAPETRCLFKAIISWIIAYSLIQHRAQVTDQRRLYITGKFRQASVAATNIFREDNSTPNLKVCHPRCVRSVIQSCSLYISIYTYSHETQQLYIIGSDK